MLLGKNEQDECYLIGQHDLLAAKNVNFVNETTITNIADSIEAIDYDFKDPKTQHFARKRSIEK